MFTYKFVDIKHSIWTGKPAEDIEEIITYWAECGWRLKQVHQDSASLWYAGRLKTKLIFEKEVEDSYYEKVRIPVREEDFVC